MAQSAVSSTIHEVTEAIISVSARRKLVDFPFAPSAKDEAKAAFARRGAIPGVLACVDGTLIAIMKPEGLSPADTVFNAELRILVVDPRFPGSCHDSWVRSDVLRYGAHLLQDPLLSCCRPLCRDSEAGGGGFDSPQHLTRCIDLFQIMYADSLEKLQSATIKLRESSQTSYFSRVEAFVNRKEEWVLIFRTKVITRGHNTNNFAEESIRILKDIVLSRTKAFNAVALVESIAEVWELYFKSRILKHAHNRVPTHHLLYDSRLKKAPEGAEASVISLGDNCFFVPSFVENGEVHDVCGDIGLCTCPAGCTGAFCKHQALVHKHFGGIFPNCPPRTGKAFAFRCVPRH
ncbi:uncharacterized protein LOC142570640 [Dermacentor variabilis]|uniref:uncharacterized protein LOC142570640 n=1 Tax=Dermacentor variabilis TaxID=34621 RepID=UPI003F5B233B